MQLRLLVSVSQQRSLFLSALPGDTLRLKTQNKHKVKRRRCFFARLFLSSLVFANNSAYVSKFHFCWLVFLVIAQRRQKVARFTQTQTLSVNSASGPRGLEGYVSLTVKTRSR